MPSLAVNGIVLRHANYRDNDRMLTLLTPDHGRMDVLARGCRRPRSPLMSASEMFCTGEYLLFAQRDRATLTSCAIHDSFYPLRLDFDRLSYGVYLLNLCEAAAQPEQPCPELFWLLIRFLSRLSYDEPRYHALTSAFLIHYAEQLGYKPRLLHCVKCGRRLDDAEPVGWDEKAGRLNVVLHTKLVAIHLLFQIEIAFHMVQLLLKRDGPFVGEGIHIRTQKNGKIADAFLGTGGIRLAQAPYGGKGVIQKMGLDLAEHDADIRLRQLPLVLFELDVPVQLHIEEYEQRRQRNRRVQRRHAPEQVLDRLPDSKHVFTHLVWKMQGYHLSCQSFPEGFIPANEDLLSTLAFPSALRAYRI